MKHFPLTLRMLCGLALCVVALAAPVTRAEDTLGSDGSEKKPIYNSETVPGDPISPEEALAALHLPEGFNATLFAAEPEVQNPIATTIDSAGRVWIAENYTYAERSQRFDMSLDDRVIVLEDTDGDGKSDSRTVFTDSVKMLTGITVGQGGVWLMCPPQLLFIPDADGDLVPDGPAQVKLDGFDVAKENYHNFANGLSWGPDSWLYGRCGASCPGRIGVPGSTDAERVPVQGGIWRYHPQRGTVEVLTHGTTNPWGHDWNASGDLFFINTVNGHFWHAIAGAHFVRPHTIDTNPYSYQLIDMHADHWHFDTGKSWTESRDGAANDLGGGHAHIGMMINHNYDWPEKYHDRVMMINMHGRRINVEKLSRGGSGYVASHEKDFVLSDDTWFRGMEIAPAPDGSVYLIDWSDTGECHDHTGVHRTSGRVFKIWYEDAPAKTVIDLAAASRADFERLNSVAELTKLAITGSELQSRYARRHLRDRMLEQRAKGTFENLRSRGPVAFVAMSNTKSDDAQHRLRALWTLYAYDALPKRRMMTFLDDPAEDLRCWAVRLLTDDWPIDNGDGSRHFSAGDPAEEQLSSLDSAIFRRLVDLADDESAAVRLSLATVLCRLPHSNRFELAEALMRHPGDADDHNLPLMVWYGLSPLGEPEHLKSLATMFGTSQWSQTRQLIARRIADQCEEAPEAFESLLRVASKTPELAEDAALGAAAGLAGRRKVTAPDNWPAVEKALASSDSADVQAAVRNLNILFGDGRTIDELVKIARSGKQPLERRIAALESLVDARAEGLKELLLGLLNTRFLNTAAARGLSEIDDPEIGKKIVENYRRFHPSERQQAVSVLATRPAWAKALLEAVKQEKIGRDEVSAFQARQIAAFENAEVTKLLEETWGQVRNSSAELRKKIEHLKADLTPSALAAANKSEGRKLFTKSCAVCHKLYGEGATLGPDLTGAQRSNMDFLLENIVDPSAVVTAQFRATILLLEDGRTLSGLLTNEDERSLTLATQQETFTIPAEEVIDRRTSPNSTMPEGLLEQMTPQQIRDLFAYLQSTSQVD